MAANRAGHDRQWARFAGDNIVARLTALISGAQQELATFKAISSQLAASLDNVYANVVSQEVVDALEDAATATSIDVLKVVAATASVRYLSEFVARVQARSSKVLQPVHSL